MTHRFVKLCRPVLTVCLLAISTPVSAESLEAPLDMAAVERAWKSGDFVQARKGLEFLAETLGTPLTQYRYGRILLEGRGGPQDVAQSMVWLEKAVAQNHTEAATLLARAILSQPKPARDAERAAALFANAAARGNAEAQYYMGLLYRNGDGVEVDQVTAFNWFLASSEGFNIEAQYELSRMYAQGVGTAQNVDEALRWMQSAASDGQVAAMYSLAESYDAGAGVGQSDSEALEWYLRAAEGGHILAQRNLGTRYLQGSDGQAPNAAEALRWLQSAAEAGDAGAMNNLAIAYIQGTVLPQDDALAYSYYTDASDRKLARATLALAKMNEAGRGAPVSMRDAVALYQLAAIQGAPAGLARLTKLSLSGRLDALYAPQELVGWITPALDETENDPAIVWMQTQSRAGVRAAQASLGKWYLTQDGREAEGIKLIRSAATAGHVPSQYRLGAAYSIGDGIDLDYVQAYAWLNVAGASGHEKSIETRGLITDLMTPDQVAEAQKIARIYFEEAINRAPQTDQTVTKVTE